MKILLQSSRTLRFVSHFKPKSAEQWTTQQAKARIFATALEALYHCYRRGIADMHILFVFSDSRPNATVLVTGAPTS